MFRNSQKSIKTKQFDLWMTLNFCLTEFLYHMTITNSSQGNILHTFRWLLQPSTNKSPWHGMQSHSALSYFHIFLHIGNGSLFWKFTVCMVKFDKKQNPLKLKYITESDYSFPQCIWIICTTPELVYGGGTRYRNTLYRVIWTINY